MPYNFASIPEVGTVEELRQFLNEELKLLSQSLNETTELELRASKHAPTRPREGMIVHADGVSWNPGDGIGTYRFQGGLWVRIPEMTDFPSALELSVKDFGAIGNGVADDTTSIANAWTATTTSSSKPRLIFPAGIYSASAFPNFGVENATVIGLGEVRLRYTGTDHAVFIDGGVAAGINNITFGPFIIECPKTAKDGLRIRNIHRSKILMPNVRGAGWTAGVPAFAGIRLIGCVCTEVDKPIVSEQVDGAGWFNSAKPLFGMLIETGVGNTSYCTILNMVFEGTTYGAYLVGALGNLFLGGVAEGCTDTGFYLDTGSTNNRVLGVDFENNTTRDIFVAGTRNEILHSDTASLITISGNAFYPNIIGGIHDKITIVAGVNNAQLGPLGFNRSAGASTITNGGTNTQLRDVMDLNSGIYTNNLAGLGGGITLITSVAAPAAATWTVTGLGGYKVLWMSFRNVQQSSGTSRILQVELSGNAGSSFSAQIHQPTNGTAFVTATPEVFNFWITRADQVNNQVVFIHSFVAPTGNNLIDSNSVGPINAVRFSWSGAATNFTGGDVDIYGLK